VHVVRLNAGSGEYSLGDFTAPTEPRFQIVSAVARYSIVKFVVSSVVLNCVENTENIAVICSTSRQALFVIHGCWTMLIDDEMIPVYV